MSTMSVWNSTILYALVIAALLTVVIICAVTMKTAWKRCIELGYTKNQLMAVVKSTSVTTVHPSIAIIIGLFSLAPAIGIPWSWFRLSVIGSVMYELMAAEVSATSVGYESVAAVNAAGDISVIGTMMFSMSIGIIGGIIINIFAGKKIQNGLVTYRSDKGEWGALLMACFSIAMSAVFLPSQFLKGAAATATLLTSSLLAVILLSIQKKYNVKWIGEFLLAICLIVGMVSSVFWHNIFI